MPATPSHVPNLRLPADKGLVPTRGQPLESRRHAAVGPCHDRDGRRTRDPDDHARDLERRSGRTSRPAGRRRRGRARGDGARLSAVVAAGHSWFCGSARQSEPPRAGAKRARCGRRPALEGAGSSAGRLARLPGDESPPVVGADSIRQRGARIGERRALPRHEGGRSEAPVWPRRAQRTRSPGPGSRLPWRRATGRRWRQCYARRSDAAAAV